MSKFIFVLLLLFTSSAFAEYQWSAENPTYTQVQIHLAPDPRSIDAVSESADAWTTADTYREATFLTLLIIDYGQTSTVAKHPELYQEDVSRWAIGKHPDQETVNTYFSIIALVHPLIAYYLPADYRKWFQYVTIGEKIPAVIGNASIGVKVSF